VTRLNTIKVSSPDKSRSLTYLLTVLTMLLLLLLLLQLCYSKPQITDEQFNLMIVKAKEDLKEKQKLVLIEQQSLQKQDVGFRLMRYFSDLYM